MSSTLPPGSATKTLATADTLAPDRPASGVRQIGRYVLHEEIGAGGMGVVYRARVGDNERSLAIKLMRDTGIGQAATDRFLREIGVLSRLRHPGIVELIDHGTTSAGQVFMVMEWLEGRDLAARLQEGPLSIPEVLSLCRSIAAALHAAHSAGIIHRDIKPSNIFFLADSCSAAKLLDFGVAHVHGSTRVLTRTGAMIGTLGYMAPEQARGDISADHRVDLFALGCVLFECLTGRPAFPGEQPMAILAKILMDDPPNVSALVPGAPPRLAALVTTLLAKEPQQRPADALAVLTAVDGAFDDLRAMGSSVAVTSGISITKSEQQVFSLILVHLEHTTPNDGDTAWLTDLAQLVHHGFGATCVSMITGDCIVRVPHDGVPADHAVLAARCALTIVERFPTACIVLCSGHGQLVVDSIAGNVIDRAVTLVAQQQQGRILVDDTTCALLDANFELAAASNGSVLLRERPGPGLRTLLGRPTPFVGRTRELAILHGILAESIEESRANAVLVVAEPGIGKSRLRHEFVDRVIQGQPNARILLGRGDPIAREAAYGLLAGTLRRLAGIVDGEQPERQRDRIADLAICVETTQRAQVTAFLGELCGVPFPLSTCGGLVAARADAVVRGDAIRLAWEAWLRAECRQHPVLLVLEDIHWADISSIALIGASLRYLGDEALFVVAFARPTVDERFPDLWRPTKITRIALDRLGSRACERLIRDALGTRLPETELAALAARADGNAFFLEELIRAAGSGSLHDTPDSILGIVQHRLRELSEEQRRLLRAASVLGATFWAEGVAVLLGEAGGGVRVRLDALARQEYLSTQVTTEIQNTHAYRFRHALVHEASYAMLPDDERRLAHRVAGEWLQAAGMLDARILAEHAMRSGLSEKASPWFLAAAQQALAGGDFAAALARAEQGLGCLPTDPQLAGELHLVRAEAFTWSGMLIESAESAAQALDISISGSLLWFTALRRQIYCAGLGGRTELLRSAIEKALATTPSSEARPMHLNCVADGAFIAIVAGHIDVGEKLHRMVEHLAASSSEWPPSTAAEILRVRSAALESQEELESSMLATRDAAALFLTAGDARNHVRLQVLEGYLTYRLGVYDESIALLTTAAKQAEHLGLSRILAYALYGIEGAHILAGAPRPDSRDVFTRVAEMSLAAGDRRMEGLARLSRAMLDLDAGRAADAQIGAQEGMAVLQAYPRILAYGHAILSRAARSCGDRPQALAEAEKAIAISRNFGWLCELEPYIRLAYIAVCEELGEHEAIVLQIQEVLERFDRRAGNMKSPRYSAAHRESNTYLQEIRRLARHLGVPSSTPSREADDN